MDKYNQPVNGFLIIYGVEDKSINSATLLVSLNSFLEIFRKIYTDLNPGAEVEFTVLPFEDGSFIIKIVDYFTKGEFRKDTKTIALSLVTTFFTNTFEPPKTINQFPSDKGIEISVTFDGQTFKIPANKLDEFKNLRRDQSIHKSFNEALYALHKDPKVKFISFVSDASHVEKGLKIDRDRFPKLQDAKKLTFKIKNYKDAELKILKIYKINKKEVVGVFLWEEKIVVANIDKYKFDMDKKKFQDGNTIVGTLIEMNENDLYTDALIHSSYKLTDIY
jgi:hypothetical protein